MQEAFTRLFRSDIDEIDDVRAWLVTVVSRVCLDQLRSARRKPQAPFDPGDARAPAASATGLTGAAAPLGHLDPADRVTLDDSVRLALQVMLERLSPAGRTAFVLHDVFQLSFDDIAGIVGRSPAACRQLASRARRQIRTEDGPTRFSVESTEQRAVTERFIAACTTGNLDALVAVLDPDVSAAGDDALAWRELHRGWRRAVLDVAAMVLERGGRRVRARQIGGRKRVARGALRYLGPRLGTTLVSVPTPGDPSVLALLDGRAVALITLTIRGGLVVHAHAVADPAKLAAVNAALRG